VCAHIRGVAKVTHAKRRECEDCYADDALVEY
jgi:hypothetical protein